MTPIFGLASLSGKLPSPGEPNYGRRDNHQKRVGKMLTTLWLSWIKIMLLGNLSKYLSQLKNYRFQHAKKKL